MPAAPGQAIQALRDIGFYFLVNGGRHRISPATSFFWTRVSGRFITAQN
jgi:hypothetical protein